MSKIKVNDLEMYYAHQHFGEDLIIISETEINHATYNLIYEKLEELFNLIRQFCR